MSLVMVVLVVPLVAGCLGDVDAAELPDPEAQGWSMTSEDRDEMAFGFVEIVTKEYEPDGSLGTTGVIVASAPSVPLFDESQLLPMALEQVEQERGITLTKVDETSLTLTNLGMDTSAEVYDFQKDGAEGQTILFTPGACDAFVVVVGYGITAAGMFGETAYQEARDMAASVVC